MLHPEGPALNPRKESALTLTGASLLRLTRGGGGGGGAARHGGFNRLQSPNSHLSSNNTAFPTASSWALFPESSLTVAEGNAG